MRVTSAATYRKYTNSVNSVHSRLNKSMNKISSGREYENAAENPLAYYEGKKMDNQYQDIDSKLALISDIKNRLYQQEAGASSIQDTLSAAKIKVEYIRNDTNNALGNENDITDTIKEDLLQKMHTIVNDLNAQYQDYYIYGGNDLSTAPFSLSADGMTLTYNHTFPGESHLTTISMTLENGTYTFEGSIGSGNNAFPLSENGCIELLTKAMSEQGRVDVGYGTIRDTSTLLDTYTGGLNLLTGLNSDEIRAGAYTYDADGNATYNSSYATNIKEGLLNSPLGLIGQAISSIKEYVGGGDKGVFSDAMGDLMDKMTQAEQEVATVYSDLGNKYSLLESTETRLNSLSDALEEQYKEKLGADPYKAITDMYSHQYSYQASLQLGSSLLKTSLFDFMS